MPVVLIFTRKPGQKIRIGNDIEITVLDIQGRKVRLGIKASRDLPIHREEVFQRIREANIEAAASVNNLDGFDDIEK